MQFELALETLKLSAWALPPERIPLVDAAGRFLAEPVLREQTNTPLELVSAPGIRLTPPVLAAAASTGARNVQVAQRPRVALLAIAQFREEEDLPTPSGKLVSPASVQLFTLAERSGADVSDFGILPNDSAHVREGLRDTMARHDVVLLCGDDATAQEYVPGLLAELGFDIRIRSVTMEPGRQLLFGERITPELTSPPQAPPAHHLDATLSSEDMHSTKPSAASPQPRTAVFVLSGDSAAAHVQYVLLVEPFLWRLQGGRHRVLPLSAPLASEGPASDENHLRIYAARFTDSGEVLPIAPGEHLNAAALAKADALILIHPAGGTLKKGALVPVMPLPLC